MAFSVDDESYMQSILAQFAENNDTMVTTEIPALSEVVSIISGVSTETDFVTTSLTLSVSTTEEVTFPTTTEFTYSLSASSEETYVDEMVNIVDDVVSDVVNSTHHGDFVDLVVEELSKVVDSFDPTKVSVLFDFKFPEIDGSGDHVALTEDQDSDLMISNLTLEVTDGNWDNNHDNKSDFNAEPEVLQLDLPNEINLEVDSEADGLMPDLAVVVRMSYSPPLSPDEAIIIIQGTDLAPEVTEESRALPDYHFEDFPVPILETDVIDEVWVLPESSEFSSTKTDESTYPAPAAKSPGAYEIDWSILGPASLGGLITLSGKSQIILIDVSC
jgi:hypothetical protein